MFKEVNNFLEENYWNKEMNITVKNREVYGNVLTYPICKKAKTFADISGRKTLTPEILQSIRELGYEVIYKNV